MKLALISNADAVEVAGWPGCPLEECFDVVIFSCDVGHVKPEREIYEACLSRMKLESGHCLFVGDGSSRELEGAQDMGLQTVMVTGVIAHLWPEEIPKRRRHADHEIRTIPELLDLVDDTGPPTRGLA
jgi:putative hydrolase of the HAD superfamily